MVVVEEEFDALAEEGEKPQRVKYYSPVWLNSKESITETIIFIPNNCLFDIQKPTSFEEAITFRSFDPEKTNSATWSKTGVTCNYSVTEKNIADWKDATARKSVSLESEQVIAKRTELFKTL